MPASNQPQPKSAAPAFHLPAYPEGKIRLSQFKGEKNVVLYFYPRDDTPGCTAESCDFRDQWPALKKADTIVLGVSKDTVESHEKFATKYSLPFPLLADVDHKVCEKYGVWVEKSNYGRKYMGIERTTFLINKKGRVVKVWPKVKVKGHVAEVAAAIDELE